MGILRAFNRLMGTVIHQKDIINSTSQICVTIELFLVEYLLASSGTLVSVEDSFGVMVG